MKTFRRAGSLSLALWSLAFAGMAFSLLSLPSIGLLVAPLALILFLFVAVWAHAWPEALSGSLIGPGLMLLLVAFLHRDYMPCPVEPVRFEPGSSSFSCGGSSPVPWLVAGTLLTGAGIIVYLLFNKLTRRLEIYSSEWE
ncbi:MAG: hypothetical protein ACYCXF_07435 [Thermoleophilia bacterium]